MPLNVTGGPLEFAAVIKGDQFEASINRIEQRLQGLTTTANKEAGAIDNLVKRTVAGLSGFVALAGLGNLIGNIAQVRGQFQQLEVAFNTMLGSKEKADKLLAEVTEFAATTPFELTEVAGAAKQLLAFGISADKIKDTLRSLGDVAAGLGQPLGEIAYLFGTIKTQGVAMTIDVRQFAQRGIPIYEALSKVLGVTTEKVGEFITAGKVGFPEIEKAFQHLTAQGSKFGGLMEAQSKTLVGLQSNLKDSVDQMFNELGKSSQGVFADVIRTATSLVKNYQKVIDVLKIIAITYGTYRAGLILTNVIEKASIVIQNAHIAAMGRLTALQKIQAIQTVIVNRVTAILNRTMLANPYVAAAAAIAGLVAAITLLADKTTAQEAAQKQLNDENEKYAAQVEDLRGKTNSLLQIVNDETATRFSQLRAFKELQQLYPGVLNNMDLMKFKTLSAEDAQKRFNEQIDKNNLQKLKDDIAATNEQIKKLKENIDAVKSTPDVGTEGVLASMVKNLDIAGVKSEELKKKLQEAEQAAWEANTPVEDQIKFHQQSIDKLKTQKETIEKTVQSLKDMGDGASFFKLQMESINLSHVIAQIDSVQGKINSLTGSSTTNPVKDAAYFEKQKKNAEEAVKALDIAKLGEKEFNRQKAEQVVKIRNAEENLKRYDTTLKTANKSTEAANKLQADYNKLLSDGQSLVEKMTAIKKEANETGLTDESLKLKNINDKYDDIISSIDTYNKKVDEFNRKNPNKPVQKVGQSLINDFGDARQRELTNFNLKKDADLYKENLEKKQRLFEQFENAKIEIGIDKARELFDKELGEYTDFQKLLQDEAGKLAPKLFLGIANVGDVTKLKAVMDQMKALDEKRAEEELERQRQNFVSLLQETVTFNKAKAAINKKYDDLETTLQKDTTIKDKDQVLKLLTEKRKEEIDAMADEFASKLPAFQSLFVGIEQLSDSAAKKVIENAKKMIKVLLEQGKISKAFADQILAAIRNAEGSLQDRIPGRLNAVAGIFANLASNARGFNAELGETVDQLSKAFNAAANLSKVKFKKDDPEGNIAAVANIVAAVALVLEHLENAKKSKKEVEQAVLDFQTRMLTGEFQYNELLRERQRQQVLLNKTTLKGLEDQKRLLLEQKKISSDSFNDLFAQIQAESFISKEFSGNKKKGLLAGVKDFLFPKKVVKEELESLAGKTFDEIEKLFTTGQLTDKAKQLFEQLKKIKDEGVDIDALLEQNKLRAQQIFTGTTSESITDSIADGFANGLRNVKDFAQTTEDIIRGAMLNALKFQVLEEPIKKLFEQFAADAESGGGLDLTEVANFTSSINNTIKDAADFVAEIEKATGIKLSQAQGGTNSLAGSIRASLTEETGSVIAGQFGGLRLTAIDQLNVARQQLENLSRIQVNTGLMVDRLGTLISKFDSYETGAKKVNVKM